MAAVVRKDRRSANWKSGDALSVHRKRPAALIACSSNRRRRTVIDATATTATASDASSWASLPEGVVGLIGWRVLAGDLRDYIRFRAVCPHWRSSTTCPRGRGVVDPRFHPRRWMMYPEGHGLHPGHGKLRGYVRFFNLSTGAFVRVKLPLFRDHCALNSTDGIMLLQRDRDNAVRLLNPLTGDITELPRLDSLWSSKPMEERVLRIVRGVVAAAISVSADGAVTVMMTLHFSRVFIYATSGDQRWRASSWGSNSSYTPLPFQGKIYLVDNCQYSGKFGILQIDLPQQEGGLLYLPPPKLIAKCPPKPSNATMIYFLVECNSEVLLITMHFVAGVMKFFIYRLADLILERIVPVTDIGGNSIFLGKFWCRMLTVSAKAFPTIMADSIVFLNDTSDCDTSHYLAQYQLSTHTLSPIIDVRDMLENAVPSSRSIFYRISTCCFREKWNKGYLMFETTTTWRVKGKWRNGA